MKPDRKGKPQRLNKDKKNSKKIVLPKIIFLPIKRISWILNLIKIKNPQIKNNNDLNKACLTIWKKQKKNLAYTNTKY